MVALFAFFAGLYYDLPLGYFILGFIILIMDGGPSSDNNEQENPAPVTRRDRE